MIATIRGLLSVKNPTDVVVDVQGVGFAISIPLSTFEVLGNPGSTVTLLTHLHIREDALQLYGFATEGERAMFRLLVSVTGIGPRMAQGILSGIPVTELRQHISDGNTGALTAIPGVGRKLSERLVVELREKISKMESGPAPFPSATDDVARVRTEALLALTSLGYARPVAERAVREAVQELHGEKTPLELLIKSALRHVAS